MPNTALAKKFLDRIQTILPAKTNPTLMNQIVSKLKLDTLITADEGFQHFFQQIKIKAMDLSALLNKIKTTLLANEPLCQILAYIEENNLIRDEEILLATHTLTLQTHLLCLFEAITITMANSSTFAADIYQHIIQQRNCMAPGNPWTTFIFGAPLEASFFERIKIMSIEPGELDFIFHKKIGTRQETQDDAMHFIEEMKLSGMNADIEPIELGKSYPITGASMDLNILEATYSDNNPENSEAGLALIAMTERKKYSSQYRIDHNELPQQTSLTKDGSYELLPDLKLDMNEKKVSGFNIDPEWQDLYSSWNLLFVIGNLDTVFLPLKLLLPSVLAAEPHNYKELRLQSLYIFANIYMNQQPNKNPFFNTPLRLEKAEAIKQQWGIINHHFAERILKKVCPDVSKSPAELYHDTFGEWKTLNYLKFIYSYWCDPENFKITAYGKNSPTLFAKSSKPSASIQPCATRHYDTIKRSRSQ